MHFGDSRAGQTKNWRRIYDIKTHCKKSAMNRILFQAKPSITNAVLLENDVLCNNQVRLVDILLINKETMS